MRQYLVSGALLLALGVVLSTPVAHAESSEADRTTARALANEGYDALERKDYATAEDRFRRADALVHAPTLVVDRARALVGLGRFVEAYEAYQLVLREGVPKNAPPSWKQAVVDAEREVKDVEPRLAWLVLRVEGPSEPRVTIDGVVLSNASLGARRPVDPGRHGIRVTADGFVSGGKAITLAEGEQQELTIKLDRPPPIELEESKLPAPATAAAQDKAPSPVPMWVAFGVGGAGLTVGMLTGVMALGVRSDLADECPEGRCRPTSLEQQKRLLDDRSTYRTLGTISGIGFGVGIAGGATGLVLMLLRQQRSEQVPAAPAAASVQPVLGPDHVGLSGSF